MRDYKIEASQFVPTWEGPYQVLLKTHTAVQVADTEGWVYHTRVKTVDPWSTYSSRESPQLRME